MDRVPVNKNVPPKTARIRATMGWIFVFFAAIGALYWLFKG